MMVKHGCEKETWILEHGMWDAYAGQGSPK
jgi:hypothetical protein